MVQKLVKSLPRQKIDELVIVNDSEIALSKDYFDVEHEMIHTQQSGVGAAKNAALRLLLSRECDYIFLIEDDMLIVDENVFNEYIQASTESGIQHLIFGLHGPANKTCSKGTPIPRQIIEYPNGRRISLYTHCVGAFCMYTKKSLEDIGILDETYKNVWEHIDHSFRLVKGGYAPGYWWWPDIVDSDKFINEQECSENNSVIRNRLNWQQNINLGTQHFIQKHGCSPVQVPDQTFDEIRKKLQRMY